jgi:adenosylcobinamide-GDP ribazoletransferase
LRDGALLAIGTFTRLRVKPPSRVDRGVAGVAMLLGPLVGVGLAAVGAVVLVVGQGLLGGGSLAGFSPPGGVDPGDVVPGGGVEPLLPAALALAAVAWCTGGLHLDGLVDVADGLGSRRPREAALAIMKRSEAGALGVLVLVFVVVVQVLALARATGAGFGVPALVLAFVTGRVVMAAACVPSVPAARADGLGATVAGSVPVVGAAGLVVGVLLVAGVLGATAADGGVAPAVLAAVAGLGAGALVVVRCVRRLGGITGDVLGAAGEVAATAVLVVCAASPGLS